MISPSDTYRLIVLVTELGHDMRWLIKLTWCTVAFAVACVVVSQCLTSKSFNGWGVYVLRPLRIVLDILAPLVSTVIVLLLIRSLFQISLLVDLMQNSVGRDHPWMMEEVGVAWRVALFGIGMYAAIGVTFSEWARHCFRPLPKDSLDMAQNIPAVVVCRVMLKIFLLVVEHIGSFSFAVFRQVKLRCADFVFKDDWTALIGTARRLVTARTLNDSQNLLAELPYGMSDELDLDLDLGDDLKKTTPERTSVSSPAIFTPPSTNDDLGSYRGDGFEDYRETTPVASPTIFTPPPTNKDPKSPVQEIEEASLSSPSTIVLTPATSPDSTAI